MLPNTELRRGVHIFVGQFECFLEHYVTEVSLPEDDISLYPQFVSSFRVKRGPSQPSAVSAAHF